MEELQLKILIDICFFVLVISVFLSRSLNSQAYNIRYSVNGTPLDPNTKIVIDHDGNAIPCESNPNKQGFIALRLEQILCFSYGHIGLHEKLKEGHYIDKSGLTLTQKQYIILKLMGNS